jgi:hypothetical protein
VKYFEEPDTIDHICASYLSVYFLVYFIHSALWPTMAKELNI